MIINIENKDYGDDNSFPLCPTIDIDDLVIYKTKFKKERIGNNYDGGYIILNIDENYDIFLSAGIGSQLDFEEGLINKYKNLKCIAFDGTIDENRFYSSLSNIQNKNNITFIPKNISDVNELYSTNLKEYTDKYNNIFLKIDAEGAEFPLFYNMDENELKKFKQIVIEWHFSDYNLFPDNERDYITNRWNVIKKIAKTHYLVHLHGNNARKVRTISNIKIPGLFECTYIRKDNIEVEINDKSIPDPELDYPNNLNKEEIYLSNYPYNKSKVIII